MEVKKKTSRKYLGVLVTADNYRALLADGDINFHRKHLKAYIRGVDEFAHGWNYNEDGDRISKRYFKVQQEIS
jgi:hypothetical protein